LNVQQLQEGNFAVPTVRIEEFIRRTNQQQTTRESLVTILERFRELLTRSATGDFVFESLSSYLSSTMINANPITSLRNLDFNTTNRTLRRLNDEVIANPVNGISWAVALFQIEIPIFEKSRSPLAQRNIRPEVISIESNNMGGYTARLLAFGYPFRTEWIREYGTWKLDKFVEDDGEYNDFPDLATLHPLGKRVIYSLISRIDRDWYVINIPRAGKLTIRTEGRLDTALLLCTDPTTLQTIERTRLDGGNDDRDRGDGLNELITVDVHAGMIYARVRLISGNTGEYILFATLE
jgi:hypothetical protein